MNNGLNKSGLKEEEIQGSSLGSTDLLEANHMSNAELQFSYTQSVVVIQQAHDNSPSLRPVFGYIKSSAFADIANLLFGDPMEKEPPTSFV